MAQLRRGGVVALDGVVRFEPDLDRGLQRCEDELLEGVAVPACGADVSGEALAGLPPRLWDHLERMPLAEGTTADPPGRSARRRLRAGIGPAAASRW